MPIANQFIAGTYSWTFNNFALGVVSDAVEIVVPYEADEVVGDNLGATVQDLILRGGNARILMRLAEATQLGVQQLLRLYSPLAWPAGIGTLDKIGHRASTVAYELVGTKIAGSNAPFTKIAMPCAVLAPDVDLRWLAGARLQEIPVAFFGLPDLIAGVTRTIQLIP